ncbi:MAG: DUF1385 domain-containing protein [Dehalococcoidia bacterium]|nr:DUF1385 domain-containing protein [Dehalococcoidia bacterium]
MSKPFHYGGQAVIEGVMMRGERNFAVSVRCPDGKLETIKQPLSSLYKGHLRETPLLRGVVVLIETLVLGTQTLLQSAQIASAEVEGDGQGEEIPPLALAGIIAASLVFGIALFFIIPLVITRYFDIYINSDIGSNIIEGFVRIGFFVAYLKLIGFIPDIRRVFAYHGAEHKVVNAYEAGRPLEISAIKSYSTAHPRCGTSFIFVVLIIAILVFSLVGRPQLWVTILSRIILLPVIAGIGYEITRFMSNHSRSALARVLLSPGLALQSMTTREPDDSQLEAAISSLNEVIKADREG